MIVREYPVSLHSAFVSTARVYGPGKWDNVGFYSYCNLGVGYGSNRIYQYARQVLGFGIFLPRVAFCFSMNLEQDLLCFLDADLAHRQPYVWHATA